MGATQGRLAALDVARSPSGYRVDCVVDHPLQGHTSTGVRLVRLVCAIKRTILPELQGGDGRHASPSFRWFTNTVSCVKCHAWVKLNASFCTQCSTPVPKLVCHSCQSTNTVLQGQHRALISGIVALVLSGSSYNQLQLELQRSQVFRYTKSLGQALTLEMLIYIGGFLILLGLAAALLYGSFGTTAKRVSCNACGRKTPLLSRTPEVSLATGDVASAVATDTPV